MQVKARTVCLECGGTGKNGLSEAEAETRAMQHNEAVRGMNVMNPQLKHARDFMRCGYCDGGYNERWISVNELLSLGM